MEEFSNIYNRVRGIVLRTYREYYVNSWELEDWEQEGMLVLYQLLETHPELKDDSSRLYVYYKVKFRNHIHDILRKQESQKRRFDKMVYEEIGDHSHSIGSPGLGLDDLVAFRSLLSSYKSGLSPEEQEQYQQLISGQRFKGRQEMLRELSHHLRDFKG